MSNKDKIIYTSKGERAATGGYLPQYDAFAIGVYDAMLAGELEEIRVADMEENVGILDDVVYVTTDNVYAYQMKWSTVDDTMAYPDFRNLIGKVVDGWRKLKRLYPEKTVLPYLITNRPLTNGDYSVKALAGKDVLGFAEYEQELLRRLKNGEQTDVKWDKAIKELLTVTGLKPEEWDEFWRAFSFLYEYKQEVIEVKKVNESQRDLDIIHIARMIQEMAGREGYHIIRTVKAIIAHLGWNNRFETAFDHNLNVPEESYVPNAQGMVMLDAALARKTKGYVFLKGSPGSGKSTLLSQWARTLPNPFARFYAFDFLNPSSQRNNDFTRGTGITFLHDIVLQLHKAGVEGNRTVLPLMNFASLKDRFYSQLDAISKAYVQTGIPFVIIVDGLDHITREYDGCTQTLMKVLPSPEEIPDGVVFVMGSQHFDHLGLNLAIEREVKENLVVMPPLSREESEELCQKLLPNGILTQAVLEKCWNKSQGHPLYLRYMLNEIAWAGVDVLDGMDDTPEGVDDYYARIIGSQLENTSLRDALGLVARIAGDIRIDDVRELCTSDSLMAIKKGMWHLFQYDKGGQTLTFFHNSFRQYLLNKTAEDILTEKYNQEIDKDYYKRLSNYFGNNWDQGYYLYKAGAYAQFISQMTPDNLYAQAKEYRPIWGIRRDLVRGVEIARQNRDPYLLVRYLLLENQLTQMDNHDNSVLSLAEEFIHTGRSSLAKNIVREGRELHCSQDYAMTLAVEYMKMGDKEEANQMFSLSYPDFLLKKHEERHRNFQDLRNHERCLFKWVETAGYFLEWPDIEKKISVFISYLQAFAAEEGQRYDEEGLRQAFMQKYLESLVNQNRLDEFENVLQTLPKDETYLSLRFSAYSYVILHIGKDDERHLNRYFAEEESIREALPADNMQHLTMVSLALRSGQPDNIVSNYLEKVKWEELGSFYQGEVGQKFETLSPFIFYVKTRARLGYNDSLTELAPDNLDHQDNELMVNYARRVFCIAQMTGRAIRGDIDAGYITYVKAAIKTFDNFISPTSHNRYGYTLSRQRGDFYEFVVKMTKEFGLEKLGQLAYIFEDYFSDEDCGADSAARRNTILAFFRAGYDKDWCRGQLLKVDTLMMEWKDVDGRVNEALEEGQAWLELGDYYQAEDLFHQMIEESFGVGYRKDYQPTIFAEWIGVALRHRPEKAIELMHWLTSRLRYLDEIAETRTGYRAAHELLNEAFKYNLRSGLKMAIWMLNEEFEYFQSVSSLLIRRLMEKSNKVEEFWILFWLYTDIHLYTDENNSYETETGLLGKVVLHGRRILGEDFSLLEPLLKRKIETECNEKASLGLLKGLDGMLHGARKASDENSREERDETLSEARDLLRAGHKEKAWIKTMEALEGSRSAGWARYYDGGSRLNICSLLQEIDPEKGRDIALDLFARDIPGGYSYGALQYLDEIIPLLTDQVDFHHLFEEEFAYMNRILRADTSREEDMPDLNPDDSSILEIVRDWLLFIAKMPVVCVSERAKMLLAHLHHETGLSIVDVLPDDVHSERLKLEVGCYLAELKSPMLGAFKDVAVSSATSSNYQYRLYAARILNALDIEVPSVPRKVLPAIYNLTISPSESYLHWEKERDEYTQKINWRDSSSIMGVASIWGGYLAHCSKIEKRTIEYAAVEHMRKYGETGDANESKDREVSKHYDRISLHFPFRKAHSMTARDGMLEVAAELMDSEAVNDRYDDGFFMSQDFSNINIDASPRPDFIPRITDREKWKVEDGWINDSEKSERLRDRLGSYNGRSVIGEYTHVKKVGGNPAMEDYEMVLSFFDDINDFEQNLFGTSSFMKDTSKYLEMGKDDPSVILLRGGYYTDFSNKTHWIAINPMLCMALGWKPMNDGLFAWQDENGRKVVESVYWQSGNMYWFTRDHYEVGEGWLVVATQEAVDTIKSKAPLFIHQKVMRRTGEHEADMSHKTYKVEDLI